jgi:hypothetical protein
MYFILGPVLFESAVYQIKKVKFDFDPTQYFFCLYEERSLMTAMSVMPDICDGVDA